MTTKTAAVRSALADLDRAATSLTAAQQAAQERQPPAMTPALTPDVERKAADVTMCHLIAAALGWHWSRVK